MLWVLIVLYRQLNSLLCVVVSWLDLYCDTEWPIIPRCLHAQALGASGALGRFPLEGTIVPTFRHRHGTKDLWVPLGLGHGHSVVYCKPFWPLQSQKMP